MRGKIIGLEEFQHVFRARIAFAHSEIVGAIALQERFVLAKKSSLIEDALVPDNDDVAFRFQDPLEFAARRFKVEPVKRLPGGDIVDALVRECSGFGGTGYTG